MPRKHRNSLFAKTSKFALREDLFVPKVMQTSFSYFWLKKHTLINLRTKGVYTDKRAALYLVYQKCRVFNPFMSPLIPAQTNMMSVSSVRLTVLPIGLEGRVPGEGGGGGGGGVYPQKKTGGGLLPTFQRPYTI